MQFQHSKAYMPHVPDCPGQSRILILCPRVLEIMKFSRKFKRKKESMDFLRPIECEGFVINSEGFVINNKCCMCCHVPIISGIPVVTDRH